MNKQNRPLTDLHELRERAEQRLTPRGMWDLASMTTEDIATMLYELETHQIELQMQNEEMRKLQEKLAEARDQYAELYDGAPVGYVTMDAKGLIVQANLTLAKMLNVPLEQLVNQPLSAFIVADDQDTCYSHLRASLKATDSQSCTLHVRTPDGQTFWVHLRTARTGSAGLRSVIDVLAGWS